MTSQSDLRQDPEAVGELLLRSGAGISTPLKKVANVHLSQTRNEVTREAGQTRELVAASPKPGELVKFSRLARAEIARRVAPPAGVYIGYPGGASRGAGADVAFAALLAGLGVISVLALALANARSVALIAVSSLFAMAGGVLALALSGGVLSIGAMAGFVALFGLSTRNTIQLLARIEELVADGEPWSLRIVVDAAQERLTPILVTTLLVSLAILPLLLRGDQPGGEILQPIAIVVTGGLIGAAAFGVLVLPLLIYAFWRPAPRRAEVDVTS